MPSSHSPASDAPSPLPDVPDPATCPPPEALTVRLSRLRGRSHGLRSPASLHRRRDPPPCPPHSNGPVRPAASARPGRPVDSPSNLDELVAILAAGLPPISLETDTLISPGEVTALLPPRRRGRKAHTSTIFRWMKSGYKGLRLPFIQVGHQRCTSINALQAFLSALTAIARFEQGDPAPSLPAAVPGNQPARSTRGADRHLRIEEELSRRHGL